jgi:hypothetical protein
MHANNELRNIKQSYVMDIFHYKMSGQTSQELRKGVCKFTDWLAYDFPPWAAYQALKDGQLVALDKFPGI